jgi:hypothetical protein
MQSRRFTRAGCALDGCDMVASRYKVNLFRSCGIILRVRVASDWRGGNWRLGRWSLRKLRWHVALFGIEKWQLPSFQCVISL